MMHADNNITLKFVSDMVVLNLQYYKWQWVREWELLEVDMAKEKCLFEVYKWERDEDKLIAVVIPVVKQEVRI